MPKNTRVHRCVDKLKKAKEEGAAIAICQASTKQGYATGKKLNSSRAYKQVGLVLAEALGYKVDEAAPLVALGAAARVGAGVIARGAAAAARLAAQGAKAGAKGAKSGAKGLGKGAKKAAISAKDMAVDAGKEKLISVAQEKAADAKNKVVGRVKSKLSKGRGLQAGPEGVAIGDDAAKKRGELKAQSDSDTDLEEGKIMNKYVTKLQESTEVGAKDAARSRKDSSSFYSRLGHIFLEAFVGPTASKYGDSRSSAGIKDPQVKADAKKAKARMDKKLGVKTNPRAKDVVQAAMNTRRSASRRGETPAGSIDNLKR